MDPSNAELLLADEAFAKARTRAILHATGAMLKRQPRTLLPFHAVRSRILVRGQRQLGIQWIRLDRIVGSEGRGHDFDRQFLPRTNHTKDRWKSIVRASFQGRYLPPIDVIKLGEVYFVRDGNHRVSVARQQGQTEIEAYVTELKTDVALRPGLTARDLVHVEEQSDFLEWTNLAQVRCSITIEVSKLGGYLDMIGHINRHRAALSVERGREVERDEATAYWYDSVYLPAVQRIRESDILQHLQGMTEADVFLAVLQDQDSTSAQGVKLTIVQATERYIAQRLKPTLLQRLMPWRRVQQPCV